MSEQAEWEAYFDPPHTLTSLLGTRPIDLLVEFGCGYGTFTLEAAVQAKRVATFDIEPGMIETTRARLAERDLRNVESSERDLVSDGTGLRDAVADAVLLFNILHASNPLGLLGEAARISRPGATVGVIHWVHDASTPRGPDLSIRPRPQQCVDWGRRVGLHAEGDVIDLQPYHYGVRLRR